MTAPRTILISPDGSYRDVGGLEVLFEERVAECRSGRREMYVLMLAAAATMAFTFVTRHGPFSLFIFACCGAMLCVQMVLAETWLALEGKWLDFERRATRRPRMIRGRPDG